MLQPYFLALGHGPKADTHCTAQWGLTLNGRDCGIVWSLTIPSSVIILESLALSIKLLEPNFNIDIVLITK